MAHDHRAIRQDRPPVAARDRAQAQLDHARAELHAAVLDDLRAGVPQAELVRAGSYTRERLRQLAREAGLPVA